LHRIVILFHEYHPREPKYLIHAMAEWWQQQGIEVSFVYGIKNRVKADLLIPQIDLTRVPASYEAYIRSVPAVLNLELMDISKKRISKQLVQKGNTYNGPVIVKTNNNCGGKPEMAIYRKKNPIMARLSSKALLWAEKACGKEMAWQRVLYNYPIYNSLQEVPEGVFKNPALVCEQFLPEIEEQKYYMRHYIFLGDHWRNVRLAALDPLVKSATYISAEEGLPVPEEILSFRQQLGMDYGKIDYNLSQGKVVILDVNKTPFVPGNPEILAECVADIDPGIWSLLPYEV